MYLWHYLSFKFNFNATYVCHTKHKERQFWNYLSSIYVTKQGSSWEPNMMIQVGNG